MRKQPISFGVVGRSTGSPVGSQAAGEKKGKQQQRQAAAAQCYGPHEQCRDRGDGKQPGAVIHADSQRNTVQEGAGEAVRGR